MRHIMMTKIYKQRGTMVLVAVVLLGLVGLSAGCTPGTPQPTPTPTRTPHPTATYTPLPPTPTLTPTPTPTPAFPVTIGCAQGVPASACARLQEQAAAEAERFTWTEDGVSADVVLTSLDDGQGIPAGAWTYVVAAPFFTVADDVTSADLMATWQTGSTGPFVEHALLVSPDTNQVFSAWWGAAQGNGIMVVEAADLLATAQQIDAWVLLPFDALQPEYKVFYLDGHTPLEKDWQPELSALSRPSVSVQPGAPGNAATIAENRRHLCKPR